MTGGPAPRDGVAVPTDGLVGPAENARARKQEETRRRILTAAAEVFAERGFTGAAMDEVAERAGVGKGTIFYNFGAKQALYEQLIASAATTFAEGVERARTGKRGWDALTAAAEEIVRTVGEHPRTAQLLMGELFRPGRPWEAVLTQARETMLAPLRAIIDELAADRRGAGATTLLADEAQVDTTAVAVLGALVLSALDRAVHAPERTVEDLVAGLVLPLSGLRPSSSATLTVSAVDSGRLEW